MRGSLLVSTKDYVSANFGKERWHEVLHKAGFSATKVFMPLDEVPDSDYFAVIDAVCVVTGQSRRETWYALGEHWINEHTKRTSPYHYSAAAGAKDFLLKMDGVHQSVKRATGGSAKPPKFEMEERPDGTLQIRYLSDRALVDYFHGLVEAVGRYFNERLQVMRVADDTVRVRFEPDREALRV